jgi:uncharacterized RDD family membrane protein YckC
VGSWSEREALDETVAATDPDVGRWATTVPSTPESMARTAYTVERPPLRPGMQPQDDELIGKVIDHFEIRGLLGEGGMGRVYLAHDRSLERPVALKLMREEFVDNPELVDRMVLEARAQARIQHPHVVPIFHIGRYRDAPYFAMEFVEGKTLAEVLIENGPLPWDEALECVIQTARALYAGHLRGISHRDVKPSNLILTRGSLYRSSKVEIKVADFGLAAPIGRREEHFVGTPRYASPEQIEGKPRDHRSDIYALGVTFHELLTGSPPFDAQSMTDLFAKHMYGPRPPIPEDKAPWKLRLLIMEMMDANALMRPPTYEELLARLTELRPKRTVAGGVPTRAVALGIDLATAAVAGQMVSSTLGLADYMGSQIALFLFAVYYIMAHRLWQRTFGKRLLGLRIQGTTKAITVPRLMVRFVVEFWGPIAAVIMISLQIGAVSNLSTVKSQITGALGFSGIPVVDAATHGVLQTVLVPNLIVAIPWLAGFLFAFFDDERRAVHDRAAHTKVVYAELAGQ